MNRLVATVAVVSFCLTNAIATPPRRTPHAGAGYAQVAQPEAPDGSTVSYVSFAGKTHSLIQFNGAHVAFLLQPASLNNRYTLAQLRTFIERLDLLYAHLRELTGRDPQENPTTGTRTTPLLHVAFAENVNHAWAGAKGIELDPKLLDRAANDLYPEGTFWTVAVHEMAHNFDFYTPFVVSGTGKLDPALELSHVWTNFIVPYVHAYNQEGELGDDAPGFLQRYVEAFFQPYLAFPSFSWNTCVGSANCGGAWGMAVYAQAGMMLRVAQLHGPAGVKAWLAYLSNAIATRHLDSAQMNDAARNDLLLESLAYGNKVDVSCYADAWNWPISSTLRAQLRAAFGPNPNCSDQDGDGASPLMGDLNDLDANVHPGAAEKANGIDEDCNGIVDDVVVDKTPGSDTTTVPLPVRIRGNILNFQQTDYFRLTLSSPRRVWFGLRGTDSSNAAGAVWLVRPGTTAADGTIRIMPLANGIMTTLPEQAAELSAGTWTFFVGSGTPGRYELLVYPVPSRFTGLTAPPATNAGGGGGTLSTPALPPELRGTAGLSARFWVETVGWAGSKPLDANGSASLAFTMPSIVTRCSLSYRVQYLSGDLPVSPASQPAPFYPYGTSCSYTVRSVSSASFTGPRLASESLATAYGKGLATSTQAAPAGQGPVSMAGTQVMVKDKAGIERPAPLSYVSPNQVNFQVPSGTALGPATVTIRSGDGVVSIGNVEIQAVVPGLFSANGDGQGVAAAQAVRASAEGEQVSMPVYQCSAEAGCVAVPIDLGGSTDSTVLVLYGTGIRGRSSLSNVRCTAGGVSAGVLYAGPQGAFAGVDQVNIALPRVLAGRGDVNLMIEVDGQQANTVTVNVK